MRPSTQEKLSKHLSIPAFHPTTEKEHILGHASEAKILITGWGATPLSTLDLNAFKQLELIVHAAGSLRNAFPDLQIPSHISVCTAAHLNARPVAEYTLGLILSSLRGAFQWRDCLRQAGLNKWWSLRHDNANGYVDRTVAIVGFGEIAKRLIALLKPFDFRILVVSEFVTSEDETTFGIQQVTLQEAASEADVLSLHEADLPCFHHMISQNILDTLRDGSILINTARGGLIDEHALVQTLGSRPILALLDVIENENSTEHDHPLFHLQNCFITPHVAGAVKGEIKRFGDFVLRNIQNHLSEKPLEGVIPLATLASRA